MATEVSKASKICVEFHPDNEGVTFTDFSGRALLSFDWPEASALQDFLKAAGIITASRRGVAPVMRLIIDGDTHR